MKVIRLAVLFAMAVLLIAFGLHAGGSRDAQGEKKPDKREGVRPAKDISVRIKNFQYDPPTVEIQVGDSVTWTNEDGAPHSATRTADPAFDTGVFPKDQSRTIKFTQASDSSGFEYFCTPHNTMRGHVIVRMAGSHLSSSGHDSGSRTKGPTVRAPKAVTVHIKDVEPYYEPSTVEIQVGDSVTWVNDGVLGHTATRNDFPSFNTGLLGSTQSNTIRFDTASDGGGFEYFCIPHPYMKGRVVVKLPGSHLAGVAHGVKEKNAPKK